MYFHDLIFHPKVDWFNNQVPAIASETIITSFCFLRIDYSNISQDVIMNVMMMNNLMDGNSMSSF